MTRLIPPPLTCRFACLQVDNTPCNDGDACSQTDLCQSGTCAGFNPITCSATDVCHVPGSCISPSGICSNPGLVREAGARDREGRSLEFGWAWVGGWVIT